MSEIDRAIAEFERIVNMRRPQRLPENFASLPRSERVALVLEGVR